MPITRIPYPNALPTEQNDYVKQNDLIEAGFLRVNDPWPIIGGNIVQGALFQVGGTVYLCTGATAIGGVVSDYVQLTPSGDGSSLTAAYVANLSGVSWNSAYNGYYDGGGDLYIFDEAKAVADGEITEVHQRNVTQDENGDVNISGQLNLDGNLNLNANGVNADRQIDFASDASILWDESENIFIPSKLIKDSIHPSDILHHTGATLVEKNLWDKLDPLIPNTGQRLKLTGSLEAKATGNTIIMSYAERTSSTVITIYGLDITAGATWNQTLEDTVGVDLADIASISM